MLTVKVMTDDSGDMRGAAVMTIRPRAVDKGRSSNLMKAGHGTAS